MVIINSDKNHDDNNYGSDNNTENNKWNISTGNMIMIIKTQNSWK